MKTAYHHTEAQNILSWKEPPRIIKVELLALHRRPCA